MVIAENPYAHLPTATIATVYNRTITHVPCCTDLSFDA